MLRAKQGPGTLPRVSFVGCAMSPQKTRPCPNPVTMTSLGNRVFADVTKWRGLCWSRVALIQQLVSLEEKGHRDLDSDA